MDTDMKDKLKALRVLILTLILLCIPESLFASNHIWVQSDWSGDPVKCPGGETSAAATHNNDREGWPCFSGKDTYVRTSIAGEASIFPKPASIIQTADLNDFDRGTLTNLELIGNGGYLTTTYQESNPAVVKTGTWYSTTLYNPSGGRYIFSVEAGASVSLTFTGTQVAWIGPKYREFGIADVYLDGVFQESVDLYSNILRSQQTLFAASGLSNTTHTIRIEVTGRKNGSATDDAVGVDAFIVAVPNPDTSAFLTFAAGLASFTQTADLLDFDRGTLAGLMLTGDGYYATTTVEENSSAVITTGQWYSTTVYNPAGGRTIFSVERNAAASLTFTGTQATWFGPKNRDFGIADVYLDGVFKGSVDLYSGALQPRQSLFTVGGLSNSTHTLMIVVTGRKNSSSQNNAVGVDAFDVVTAYPDVNASLRLDAGYTSGSYESPSFYAGSGGALLHTIFWNAAVPAGSGLKFQIATNKDNQTWNFMGPDGTSGSYYEPDNPAVLPFSASIVSNCPGSPCHDEDLYIRYKAFFSSLTTDPADSPVLQDVTVGYGLAPYRFGVYESPSFDLGPGGAFLKSIIWNATIPAGSGIKFQIATNDDNQTWNFMGPDGTSGSYYVPDNPSVLPYSTDIGNNCPSSPCHDEDRYVRYKAFFERPRIDPAYDPLLNDVTITFEEIPPLQILVSSPYDTTDVTNVINRWTWSESAPAGTDISLQLRTSPNGSSWSPWYGPHATTFSAASGVVQITVGSAAGFDAGDRVTLTNSANASQYEVRKIIDVNASNSVITLDSATSFNYAAGSTLTDTYADPGGTEPVNPIHRSGYSGNNNDRWLQYRVILFSELGTVTPSFLESRIGYFTAAGVYQPDLIIGTSGNDSYGDPGSGAGGDAAKSAEPGFKLQPLPYDLLVQNDGTSQSVDDTFIISWNTPSDISGDWVVLLNDGNADLTSPASVFLNAGSEGAYTLRITPSDYAPGGSTQDIILNIHSESDYAKADSVRASTQVNSVYQLDGLIDGDGDNQYDPDRSGGGGASQLQEAGPGDAVLYNISIQNEGNVADTYTIYLSEPLPYGWTASINDGSGDHAITTSTGFTTASVRPQPYSDYVKTLTLKIIPAGQPLTTDIDVNIYSSGAAQYMDSLRARLSLKAAYKADGVIYGYGYNAGGSVAGYRTPGAGCGTASAGDNIYGALTSGNGGCAALDIPAGSSSEITVGIQNEGNIPDSYRLSWSTPSGWSIVMQERLNDGSTAEYNSPVDLPTQAQGNPSNYNGGEVPYFTIKITPPSSFDSGSETIRFDIRSTGDSGKYDSVRAVVNSSDTTPPASADLDVSDITSTSLKVSWTAPGDDGESGTAASYDLRYSTSPITEGSFAQASRVASCKPGESNPGKPKPAGESETCTISQLFANIDYYFALKTSDDAGNVSSISACPGCPAHTSESDDAERPGTVTDLRVTDASKDTMTLCWTAPADDESDPFSGPVTGYDLRYSTREIVGNGSAPGPGQVEFSSAIPVTPAGGYLSPRSPGMPECHIVPVENKIDTGGGIIDDRTLNTRFYFAVISLDERGADGNPSVADGHMSHVSSGQAKGLTPVVPYAYNMVSVPYHPNPDRPVDVLGDDVGTPLYAYRWDSRGPDFDSGCYDGEPAPFSSDPAQYTCSRLTSISEGAGYFLWAPSGKVILDVPSGSAQPPAQTCADDNGIAFQCYALSLKEGWNMIGNPFDKETGFSPGDVNNNGNIEDRERGLYVRRTIQGQVQVESFQDAVAARNWIDGSIYTFNGINYTFETCDSDMTGDPSGARCSAVMQPWKAYWIRMHAAGGAVFELLIPY